jgi:hypothetical protein
VDSLAGMVNLQQAVKQAQRKQHPPADADDALKRHVESLQSNADNAHLMQELERTQVEADRRISMRAPRES